jgi:GNAT superfamily N-acetyltransferase
MAFRFLGVDDHPEILGIINAAAVAYRGVIPDDRWHEPYMSAEELDREIEAGVGFVGYEVDGRLIAVMGSQPVQDVVLIRHAYVRPDVQRGGFGGKLLDYFIGRTTAPILIGTWASAEWAIRFYEKHGFRLLSREETPAMLRKYWRIPDRQIETSVVLSNR